MSERYTKVFALPENLYAEGSPVIVSAGHLLKDNQTGKVLAQLKIKNISPKAIKAATVLVHSQDTAGKAIDGDAQQKYLDLTAKTGEEFGQKTAVPLPDASTRAFSLEVTQVVFEDSSTWEGTQAPWEPLPEAVSLSKELGDAELVKQYRLKAGPKCALYPKAHKDIWLCACGTWNRGGKCYACGKEKDALLNLDLAALAAEKDARLAREKAEREAREVADKAAAEARAKKTKKILAISIPAAVIIIIVATLLLVTKVLIPKNNYNKAKALLDAEQYEQAITAFEALDGYGDSKEQIKAAKSAIIEAERLAQEAEIEAKNAAAYEEAEALFEAGNYEDAIAAFRALGDYRDSKQKMEEVHDKRAELLYLTAVSLQSQGKLYEAATTFYQAKEYKDAWERCFALWGKLTTRDTISVGNFYTVGLKADGTVVAKGSTSGFRGVNDWKNIIAVAAGYFHTVGLKADGTVVAAGDIPHGECNVNDWTDIVAIAAGCSQTVGLKADGTVVATIEQQKVSGWTDIVAIAAGGDHTVGLKADGTVIAAGSNKDGQCNVNGWTDIVAIAAGLDHTLGLKADGTVVAAGRNDEGQCDVSGWKNIVSIAAGFYHTVGLKTDGTVVAVGSSDSNPPDHSGYDPCNVSDWADVVEIAAGYDQTVGLKKEGTIVVVGVNYNSSRDVSGWTNIKLPD